MKNMICNKSDKINKLDKIIIVTLTIMYLIMSFINLGDFKSINNYYVTSTFDKSMSFMLDDNDYVSKIRHFTGNKEGSYELYISDNNIDYIYTNDIDQTSVFAWKDDKIDKTFKYFKLVADSNDSVIGEIALYDENDSIINIHALDEKSKLLIDEGNLVPKTISYMNSSYFDEIYFARTAYEYANDLEAYEWVHPPLGKLIQMIPIKLFGMSPFNYRLMGALAGVLLIPLMYIFSKKMFKSTLFGITGGMLIFLNNFIFAQSRMGTVDTFLVLFITLSAYFMYEYINLNKEAKLKKKLLFLFLSGLFFGLSSSVKWTGLFFGVGLAIIFFLDLFKKKDKDIFKIIASCILFFVIIPLIIYIGSYFVFPKLTPYNINTFSDLIRQTEAVYEYHSGLSASHPFTSDAWSWPFMIKPVWYYVSYLGDSVKGTISGIGNPFIWIMSTFAVIYLIIDFLIKNKTETKFLLILILSLYIPYFFIGRVMFLYHYFPVIPFATLGLVSLLKYIYEKTKKIQIIYLFLFISFLFFIVFFPITSGIFVNNEYIDFLKWLPTWFF